MKKGQVAVEYLTTYGWAIFALLIVIVVLVSTGVFSPSYLVSEECNFGNNLKCHFSLYDSGVGSTKIILTIFNGMPYKINVTSIALQTQDGIQYFTDFVPSHAEIESGSNVTITASLSGAGLPVNTVKRFLGNITYVSCAPEIGPNCSTVSHILSGRITGRVVQG